MVGARYRPKGGAGRGGAGRVRQGSPAGGGVHPPEGEDREVLQAGQGRTQLLGAVGLQGAPPAEARSSPPTAGPEQRASRLPQA